MAVDIPEKIVAALSEAQTTKHIENGSKEHYTVFNDGGGWGEVTLFDTREGLESFVAWACGRDPNGDNDWASVFSKDPLLSPKAFKNALSPILVLVFRRPQEETLAGTASHVNELISDKAKIEAFMAKSLVESIAVPGFGDKDNQGDDDDQDD